MSIKINKAIASHVHDEKLEMLKELKNFMDEKMDDADDVNEMIDEFMNSLSIKIIKVSKEKSVKGDKPKRTRKPTFYNHWLGQRLKSFAEEQKSVDDDEKVGKGGRMAVIAEEWKEFKESDDFEAAKAEWEKMSDDETLKVEKSPKKEEKPKKKTKKKKIVSPPPESSDDSSDDEDNSPQSINSDSEDDDN